MGAGATTLAETPKPDLGLSQSDSLSTFDSLAQSSTLDRSMSLKQSWHASYMQRSRSARIREDDVPHKLAISFGGSGRTLLEDDDDWIAVKETEFDDEEPWQRPKLRKGRLDESYRLTESGTILLRETTRLFLDDCLVHRFGRRLFRLVFRLFEFAVTVLIRFSLHSFLLDLVFMKFLQVLNLLVPCP